MNNNQSKVTTPPRPLEKGMNGKAARAWRERITIPTYEVGKPEKNPIFLEKRVYQGSSGVVYPYPVIEKIYDEKVNHEYEAVWLENEYIKVMILPELGGRVQMAYDKIKQRHFVYYNHVIKPALVGLTGPWISGGIEFNWPQHHRPSTYMPIDSTIEENEDGSVTVWCNEMERMFHQKALVGFILRPGCAYLEIRGQLSNRTSLPQTFLWWANPAVEVNDAYQSVFPPDVNAVFDHGKRAVSSFPIATGTYYKMDYSAGVDISNYKNIKVPTSYMAVNSKYDFEGGYENDTQSGMLHVASHHFSPGKKQWTWGNGDFGRAWDRNLTDEVATGYRPYIELMAGVYTENQPDFTWLMPYEEKQFVQYFMPYRELGIVKQASKDFIMNIETFTPNFSQVGKGSGQTMRFQVLATSKQTVRITLRNKNEEVYYDEKVTLSPEDVFEQTVDVKKSKWEDLLFAILSAQASSAPLLTWRAEPDEIRPIPDAAEAALPPADTQTNDQLYLTGLHLEQYRHATWSALDYYEEALRRDPNDVRCLNQMGLWYLRRGRFDQAETYLRRAVKIWQKRNPNPYDGEPIFNLALCLKYQYLTEIVNYKSSNCKLHEAYELFWKATWNKAWADAGYFEAACISVSEGRFSDALDELDRCLISNSRNHKARALKAAVLRKLEHREKALAWIHSSLAIDRFNYGCLFEARLLGDSEDLVSLMHGNVYNYHELALDYAGAGLWQEAEAVLTLPEVAAELVAASPLTSYYLGCFKLNQGNLEGAKAYFQKAENTKPDGCFPNRLEDVVALNAAIAVNEECCKARYYLGCLYYDKRQYDLAIENWEVSAQLDPDFPTVWRNLALGIFNKGLTPNPSPKGEGGFKSEGNLVGDGDISSQAVEYMERAFALDEDDARVLMELDQLYKRLHRPHAERLSFLQRFPQLIERRDDLILEEITLLNQLGRYEEAMRKLDAHVFHPWEGGEGKVPTQYVICRVELAKQLMSSSILNPQSSINKAISLLQECLEYPPHLGEGKLYGAQENDIYYLLGIAWNKRGDQAKARECWERATEGAQEPAAAIYYNDAKPDKIFYQGLALYELGREEEAHGRFYKLINYGKQHLFEKQVMDYFAVSLPDLLIWDDSLDAKNVIHCKYMLSLGYYGMGDRAKAERYLKEVEALDNNHQGIRQLRTLMDLAEG